MTVTINAVTSTGLVQTSDGSGVIKVQSNGVTTNALAWVNFNGQTATIRSSYNVSSVTRNAAGDYTVNITNATADTNYAIAGSCMGGSSSGSNYVLFGGKNANTTNTQTTSAVQITTGYVSSTGGNGGLIDHPVVSVAIFGN